MVLSTAYFPPIEYFALMAKCSIVYLEACENYQKQSYRNRFCFYADNGRQALNFPVVHENGTFSLPITKIKVDYSTPWVVRTERAITSAYSSSAFFEYYKDELFAILDSHPETLWDLNFQLIQFFVRKIGLAVEIRQTESSSVPGTIEDDYREIIHPKRTNTIMEDLGAARPYYQVFADRHGFIPGLSVMDLLFNEGPESICYLKR